MNERKVVGTWHWRRGSAVSAWFLLVCWLHLTLWGPNSGVGDHPFLGPLVILHAAKTPLEYGIGVSLWAVLGAGLCLPAFRFTATALALCFCAAVAWVGISMAIAGSASC
jgi:hypothetical protein